MTRQHSATILALATIACVLAAPRAHATDLVCGSAQTVSHTTANVPQDFTIPTVNPPGSLRLTVHGADGGAARSGSQNQCVAMGGEGATVTGVFPIGFGPNQLQPGGTIRFIIGRKGGDDENTAGTNFFADGGGGGGTGVLYRAPGSTGNACNTDWIILLAAGGGGGAHQGITFGFCTNGWRGGDGRPDTCGGSGGGINAGGGGCDGNSGGNGGAGNSLGYGGAGAFQQGDNNAPGCPSGGTAAASDAGSGGWGFGPGGP